MRAHQKHDNRGTPQGTQSRAHRPLEPIPDDFDLDYLLLQDEVFDELYLQSKIDDLELPDYELLEDREHI
jgi:hypothetical protein